MYLGTAHASQNLAKYCKNSQRIHYKLILNLTDQHSVFPCDQKQQFTDLLGKSIIISDKI